jgi:Uma2 family endonuclease
MANALAIGPERIRPISRAEYDRLVELGWFEHERIELLRGVLVTMSPQGSRHAEVLRRLNRLLVPRLGDRAYVQVQSPLALGDSSEPEPDVAVVPPGDYSGGHPSTAHVVIEVADSSLAHDRDIKLAIYAESGIPEYWIINLVDSVIAVHTDPEGMSYRTVTTARRGERVHMSAFPDISLAVDELL